MKFITNCDRAYARQRKLADTNCELIIGEPMGTEQCSAEEIKKMGLFGLYEREKGEEPQQKHDGLDLLLPEEMRGKRLDYNIGGDYIIFAKKGNHTSFVKEENQEFSLVTDRWQATRYQSELDAKVVGGLPDLPDDYEFVAVQF